MAGLGGVRPGEPAADADHRPGLPRTVLRELAQHVVVDEEARQRRIAPRREGWLAPDQNTRGGAFAMLGDDRAVARTYIAGEIAYRR